MSELLIDFWLFEIKIPAVGLFNVRHKVTDIFQCLLVAPTANPGVISGYISH